MRTIQDIREDLIQCYSDLACYTGQKEWKSKYERPENDAICVVITKTGAMYFQHPHDGKFMRDVEWWMQLPERPERR